MEDCGARFFLFQHPFIMLVDDFRTLAEDLLHKRSGTTVGTDPDIKRRTYHLQITKKYERWVDLRSKKPTSSLDQSHSYAHVENTLWQAYQNLKEDWEMRCPM